MGYVREYHTEDATFIATHMREADKQEVQAAVGLPPKEALLLCARVSGVLCTIVDHHEKPAAMFGVTPVDDLAGAVWLLGTDALVSSPLRKQFLREGRHYVDRLHTYRPLLFNYVDERNVVHVRWITWMGFTIINRHPAYGVERRPFLEFVKVK